MNEGEARIYIYMKEQRKSAMAMPVLTLDLCARAARSIARRRPDSSDSYIKRRERERETQETRIRTYVYNVYRKIGGALLPIFTKEQRPALDDGKRND